MGGAGICLGLPSPGDASFANTPTGWWVQQATRIAVDIGGTFTDLALVRNETLESTVKTLTTYPDPSEGVAMGLRELLEGREPQLMTEIVHGTTLVSNSLIERKGARTALVTSEGFIDVLTTGREQRYDLYDLFIELPEPLAPRRRRYAVAERVLADGTIDTPLDRSEVEALVPRLRADGIEAVAVCFLHSYLHPEHERLVADVLSQLMPDVAVSLSSDVSPEVGEFHRSSTTVANAFVLPVVDRYLEKLEEELRRDGISAPLHIMLSTGGLATTDVARRFPVRLLESGPAAGVLAAGHFGAEHGTDSVLAFDMGGTTAKAGLVDDGQPLIAREHETARVYRFTKGSGMPIRVPVIDLIEIGAGGGSIARVGPFELPKVGPDSASSDPGPACYGRGGTDPTVTDADLILGYLDPNFFLGGAMPLDLDAARQAISSLGARLGLSLVEAAAAIHRVVNENMASAARMHAIERGRDIRRYVIVATGGAGPVHAWGVARSLGVTRLVFPPNAGVASAFGMLTAPPSFDYVRSLPSVVEQISWDETYRALNDMIADGHAQLAATGRDPHNLHVSIGADVRYHGQGDSITVELGTNVPQLNSELIHGAFETQYLQLFGSRPPEVEAELLTWRVRVAGDADRPRMQLAHAGGDPHKGERRMWFVESSEIVDAAVFDRYALEPGYEIKGPAVVEERESTVVIGPGGLGTLDESGNLGVVIHG